MASGIWPSVSGAIARERTVQTVSNNLANVNTAGFKKDETTFKEYLTNIENPQFPNDIPLGPVKEKHLYPLDGADKSFVVNDGVYTNFKEGHLQVTHAPLDLALQGTGFFEVSTPNGTRYTKNGSFRLNSEGRLVTREGFPVLASQPGGLAAALSTDAVQPSQGGQQTQGGVTAGLNTDASRFIELADVGKEISINNKGEIYAGGDLISTLSIVEFEKPELLEKKGGLLFSNELPSNVLPPVTENELMTTQVHQGMLETSNVNAIEEMTKLIQAHRLFEHDLKSIRVHDQMMDKESNDIGKL